MARKHKRRRGVAGPRAAVQAPAAEQASPREVPALLEALSSSTGTKLAEEPMRQLKRVARDSPASIKEIFQGCMARMRTQHSQVRYLALLIVDALVMRSRDFRRLLIPSLPALLPLLLGHVAGSPLPPPRQRAKLLTDTGLECLQRWAIVFGAHPQYIHLLLARRYVEGTLRMKLPDLRARASAQERERVARRERTQALLAAKFGKVKDEVPRMRGELASALREMERCLGLINAGTHEGSGLPMSPSLQKLEGRDEAEWARPDEEVRAGGSDAEEDVEWDADEPSAGEGAEAEPDDEWGEVPSAMRAAALETAAEQQRQERMEQQQMAQPSVFQLLQDRLGSLQKQWLPTTEVWVTVLSRVEDIDAEQVQERDALLRVVIDLRAELKAMERRCLEAGVHVPADDSERAMKDPPDAAAPDAFALQEPTLASTTVGPSMSGARVAQANTEPMERADGSAVHPAASADGQAGDLPPTNQGPATGSVEPLEAGPSASGKARNTAAGPAWEEAQRNDRDGSSASIRGAEHSSSEQAAGAEAAADVAASGGEPQKKRRKLEDLRKSAPVLPWGMHLEYWGADAVPVNSRGLEVQNHWGPVDDSVCMPQERLEELTLAMTTYKPRSAAASQQSSTRGVSCTPRRKPGEGSRKADPSAEALGGVLSAGKSQGSISLGSEGAALSNPHSLHKGPRNTLEPLCIEATLKQPLGHGSIEASERMSGGAETITWPNANWAKTVQGAQSCTAQAGEAQALAGLSPDLVMRQLARHAVRNVRAEDAMNVSRKKEQGRAAAARAHNDSVLRRVAMQDVPVPADGRQGPLPRTRDQEQRMAKGQGAAAALKAMLKPPASSKSRLKAVLERKRRQGRKVDAREHCD